MPTDDEIRDSLERMRAADEARRAAERSTPQFHNAAAEVAREARRVFELVRLAEVESVRQEEPGDGPDPLDDI